MRRLFAVSMIAVSSFALTGCDALNELLGVEEEGSAALTTELLTGAVIQFTNPNPDTSIGELSAWDYVFRSGSAVGCNQQRGYTSTGWTVIDDSTVRVHFGSQYEQYQLTGSSGTLADGNLSGTFHLTSSVPGNVVDGTFVQRSTPRFSGCN